MKKIKIILWISIGILLIGCGKHNKKEIGEECIRQMLTYSEAEEVDWKAYFTEEGYDAFLTTKTALVYPTLMKRMQIDTIDKIKIDEKECIENRDSIQKEYQVEYSIHTKTLDKQIEDQIKITYTKEGLIEELIILNTSDSIEELFFKKQVK